MKIKLASTVFDDKQINMSDTASERASKREQVIFCGPRDRRWGGKEQDDILFYQIDFKRSSISFIDPNGFLFLSSSSSCDLPCDWRKLLALVLSLVHASDYDTDRGNGNGNCFSIDLCVIYRVIISNCLWFSVWNECERWLSYIVHL